MYMIRAEFKKLHPREEIITSEGVSLKYVLYLESLIGSAEDEIEEFKNSMIGRLYYSLRRKK